MCRGFFFFNQEGHFVLKIKIAGLELWQTLRGRLSVNYELNISIYLKSFLVKVKLGMVQSDTLTGIVVVCQDQTLEKTTTTIARLIKYLNPNAELYFA